MLVSASISEKDYPKAAKASGVEGDVTTKFVIDQKGRAVDCISSNGVNSMLVAGSCAVVARWRFRPAKDASGKAVASPMAQTFQWRLYAPCPVPATNTDICINLQLKKPKIDLRARP